MSITPLALEVRGLRKRFTVGYGSCLASAEVLRGVDLCVAPGEVLAIVGEVASGKSTLLLCAAGLVRADEGDVTWFGAASPLVAARRVMYHLTRADLMRGGAAGEAKLHLVDVDPARDDGTMRDWVPARREAGDAVIFATRNEQLGAALSSRMVMLKRGTLHESARAWPRVAEGIAG